MTSSDNAPVTRFSVAEYFETPETLSPRELDHGILREPPAPGYGHQSVVTRLGFLLYHHVRERGLGQVCVSPVDVVLDEPAALVVQPDIIFVGRARLSIIRERVFGPPDLTIEILSPTTAARDQTTKLEWYRGYGVRECWLVDKTARSIEVVVLQAPAETRARFADDALLRSSVLPDWTIPASAVFE